MNFQDLNSETIAHQIIQRMFEEAHMVEYAKRRRVDSDLCFEIKVIERTIDLLDDIESEHFFEVMAENEINPPEADDTDFDLFALFEKDVLEKMAEESIRLKDVLQQVHTKIFFLGVRR